jgi:hypothetical protein
VSDAVRSRHRVARHQLRRDTSGGRALPPCLPSARARPVIAGTARRRAWARRRAATGAAIVRQRADFAEQSKGRVLDLRREAALQDLRAAGVAAAHHLPVIVECDCIPRLSSACSWSWGECSPAQGFIAGRSSRRRNPPSLLRRRRITRSRAGPCIDFFRFSRTQSWRRNNAKRHLGEGEKANRRLWRHLKGRKT